MTSEQPPKPEDLHLPEDSDNPLAMRFDWRALYEDGTTPWDLGGAHPGLVNWLTGAGWDLHLKSAVVPGCGKGSDVICLAKAGMRVAAIDAVDLCGEHFAQELGQLGGSFHVTNFLKLDGAGVSALGGPWQLLYEHTIFCAIDPEQRAAFGAAAAAAVAPGGYLLTLLFPIDKPLADGGPPHRAEPAHMLAALGDAFELIEQAPCDDHAPGRFQWTEQRMLFRRRG